MYYSTPLPKNQLISNEKYGFVWNFVENSYRNNTPAGRISPWNIQGCAFLHYFYSKRYLLSTRFDTTAT